MGQVSSDEGMQIVKAGDVVFILPEKEQKISNYGDTDLVFLAICHHRFQEKFYVDCEQD